MDLIAYGQISDDFSVFAKLRKLRDKIVNNELEYKNGKVDCYPLNDTLNNYLTKQFNVYDFEGRIFCLNDLELVAEIFSPNYNYPPHIDVDGSGLSFFIPLETGEFTINHISYPVRPFVLYSFDDKTLHNSNFCSIMIREK